MTSQLVRDGGGILSRTTATGAAFYGYDGNGNVTLLTDSAGADVGRYRYDAFGQTLEATGPRAGENPYRFSTKEFHAQSGLYDYGFRFYSPGMGRWLNRDPIAESGGINLYGMVGNNPINNVDEYGLHWLEDFTTGVERWVNGHLEPPKATPSNSDEAGADDYAAAQNVAGAIDHGRRKAAQAAVIGMEGYMAVLPGPKVPRGSSLTKVPNMLQGVQRKKKYIQVNVTRRGTKESAKALLQRINKRYGNQPLVIMKDMRSGRVVGLRNQSSTVFYRPKLGRNGQIANVEVIRNGRRIDIHIIK